MSVSDKAKKYHGESMNCAQSVLCALTEDSLGVDTARLIAAGFGGGLRSGKVCGALSGAVMAIGLALGKDDLKCGKAGSDVAEATKTVMAEFRNKYGTVDCEELLKSVDGKRRCEEFIAFCAELADSEIDKRIKEKQ